MVGEFPASKLTDDFEYFEKCCIHAHRDKARSSLLERHGAFYSLDYLATLPRSCGRGLASLLLGYLLARADDEGRAMFLVATSPRLRDWYQRHGFQETRHARFTSSDGFADLFFMERVPHRVVDLL